MLEIAIVSFVSFAAGYLLRVFSGTAERNSQLFDALYHNDWSLSCINHDLWAVYEKTAGQLGLTRSTPEDALVSAIQAYMNREKGEPNV